VKTRFTSYQNIYSFYVSPFTFSQYFSTEQQKVTIKNATNSHIITIQVLTEFQQYLSYDDNIHVTRVWNAKMNTIAKILCKHYYINTSTYNTNIR